MNKKTALKIRKKIKKKKPDFKRQESHMKKLKKSWRKPKGIDSKLRVRERGRGKRPEAGYRSPKAVRGLNPQGFREVLVVSTKELEEINPETEIGVIRASVGAKKRAELMKLSQKKGIRISGVRWVKNI